MNTVIKKTTAAYRPRSSILYVIEADEIHILDEKQGLSWSLQGTEAALWDLLAAGYPYQKVVHFISLWPNLPEADAEQVVLTILESWYNQGILEKGLDDQSNP